MSLSTAFHAVKDPSAILDYQFNWSAWLGADTIATSTWAVPTGITQVTESETTTTTTIWLSGGTVDTNYVCVNTITTAGGRTDQRTLTIRCREK